MRTVNCNITPRTDAIAAAFTDAPIPMPITLVPDSANPGRCALELPDEPYPQGPIGLNVVVMATGYQKWQGRVTLPAYGQTIEGISIELKAGIPPFPARPDILTVRMGFQGLQVQTPTYGRLQWFETLAWMPSATDRQAAYAAKHANGDTHAILDLSGAYMNDQGFSYPVPGKDWTDDLPGFRALCLEVIQNGFWPMVFLAGDGQGAGPGYNDPNGWTYGHDWLMAHLRDILTSLEDLWPYIVFSPGYDGVFYGWSPEQVTAFGDAFRAINPHGYLMIEHTPGNIPIGNGPSDYAAGGPMQAFDLIASEFLTGDVMNDECWQVLGRLLGPAYVRPTQQPSWDDPNPPYYLVSPTPRGPFAYWAMEYFEYDWVRGTCSSGDVERVRQQLHQMGASSVG